MNDDPTISTALQGLKETRIVTTSFKLINEQHQIFQQTLTLLPCMAFGSVELGNSARTPTLLVSSAAVNNSDYHALVGATSINLYNN